MTTGVRQSEKGEAQMLLRYFVLIVKFLTYPSQRP